MSSKEIDFRETIIKQEKKRLKKERKIKEKELKKLRALNGGSEDGAEGETGLGTQSMSGSSATPGIDDDEEMKSESSSSESESSSVSKSPNGTHQGQKKITRKSSIRENDDGDVSSVSTRKSKTERNHYILRTAIDEKYVPRSI